ncbi:MAG: hypothetical protein Q7J98_04825 [Kiritimatiellia bacterium]|nr:hypothetical protein [Kiritimatiellia bacterium]
MKKVIAMLSGLLVAAAAMATPIQQDTLELRLGGNIDFDNPNGKLDFLLDTGLGYFVLDNIEAGGLVAWGYNGSEFGYGIGGFGEFNLDLDSFVMPYVGLKLQYFFGDFYVKNFLNVEFTGGSKFFLSEEVAIFTELYYDLASEDAYINDDEAKNYDVGMKLGVRCYF